MIQLIILTGYRVQGKFSYCSLLIEKENNLTVVVGQKY